MMFNYLCFIFMLIFILKNVNVYITLDIRKKKFEKISTQ